MQQVWRYLRVTSYAIAIRYFGAAMVVKNIGDKLYNFAVGFLQREAALWPAVVNSCGKQGRALRYLLARSRCLSTSQQERNNFLKSVKNRCKLECFGEGSGASVFVSIKNIGHAAVSEGLAGRAFPGVGSDHVQGQILYTRHKRPLLVQGQRQTLDIIRWQILYLDVHKLLLDCRSNQSLCARFIEVLPSDLGSQRRV
ncbi:hypothetical protein MSG28_009118 [Choristoneura fumiferana]|uniref:Uncharacterized protein n=1 Tax=Choristoneura fumiferana TaxID=7141 RepID=A0ACC0KWA2_CHOFU|nr:hypothetical protein MSG28_009118 [Choristoneura fumiferana]